MDEYRKRVRIGYMDLTAYDHELGEEIFGTKVYPSVKDCIESNRCIEKCGIIKVEIRAVEIIKERNEALIEENNG